MLTIDCTDKPRRQNHGDRHTWSGRRTKTGGQRDTKKESKKDRHMIERTFRNKHKMNK